MDRGVVPIFICANDTTQFFSRAYSLRLVLKLLHSTLTSNTIDLEVGCITVRHFTILLDGKLLVGMQFSYLIADTVAHVFNRKDTCLMLVSTPPTPSFSCNRGEIGSKCVFLTPLLHTC